MFLFFAPVTESHARPGFLDDSPMGIPDNTVSASVRQADGKIVFGGGFLTHDGLTLRRVARLNVDGSTDISFVARVGNDNVDPAGSPQVSALAVQPADGHILVGGIFTEVWDTRAVRLARLNPGGSHDTSFEAEANGRVTAIAVQSDGRILVGGEFTQINSTPRQGLARLESDGTLDPSFNPAPAAPGSPEPVVIRKILVRDDGSIIVGGSFSQIGGGLAQSVAVLDPAGNLARVIVQGDWVRGLLGGTYPGVVHDLSFSRLWELTCYGQFFNLGAVPTGPYMAGVGRYSPNGRLDWSFANTESDNSLYIQVFAGALQSDNSSIIGGRFEHFQMQPRNHLAKLRADGSIAPGFRCDITPLVANPTATPVQTLATFPDGSIFVGGAFDGAGAATGAENAVRLWRDGSADIGFAPDFSGLLSYPKVEPRCVVQPDGKILVAGRPETGTNLVRLTRLFANGMVDPSFEAVFQSTSGPPAICSLAVLEDGSILAGGTGFDFRYNGPAGPNPVLGTNLVKLGADGTPIGLASVTGGSVNCIAVQPDGRILIAGDFTNVNGSSSHARLARLLPNGTLDPDFTPVTFSQTTKIHDLDYSHADGKILIAGTFTTVNGFLKQSIARLGNDGSLDGTYSPSLTNGGSASAAQVKSITLQPDGKAILTGFFDAVGGVARNGIARLNENGTLDTGFELTPSPAGFSPALALQANGQLLAATVETGDGVGIRRFNPDGSTDSSFNRRNLGFPSCVTLQADARVLVGGDLGVVTPGDRSLARLQNNPAENEILVLSPNSLAWRRGGGSPEAQHVSFELSRDGCRTWSFLGHGTWMPDGSWLLADIELPASGHIRGRARIPVNSCDSDGFSDGGSSSLVEEISAFRTPIDFTIARWLTQNYNVPFNISPGMTIRDSDGDSLSDFREMAFGTHPFEILSGISRLGFGTGPNGLYLISAGQPAFQVQSGEGGLESRGSYLRRRDGFEEGIFYLPEFSRNLEDWYTAYEDDETATTLGGGYELMEVSPPSGMPPGSSLFFRVGLRFRP